MKMEAALTERGKVIAEEKGKADEALMEALPALALAAAALENLNKKDIQEIKAFATPPTYVQNACMCVAHLNPRGKKDDASTGWKGAKVMLGDMRFLDYLLQYDKDTIKDRMIRKVKTYFRDPDFTVENMKSVSKAGAGLLQWVVAIVKYHGVAKNVEPLKLKVAKMEKEQAKSEQELGKINAELAEIATAIAALTKEFEAANGELTALKTQADAMERRLTAASRLIAGLSSESKRWTADKEELGNEMHRLTGDCLITAAFLSYVGAFSKEYRNELIDDVWQKDALARNLPLTMPFGVERLLVNDATKQQWISEDLPGDDLSVQNGILTTRASRFPLCIDPQMQAVRWIKKKEAPFNLTVKTFNDGDFLKHLELAIQFGKPFLFEGVDEELDPVIDPVLEKNTFVQGTQLMIKLGDKSIDWDKDFRLYLTSKLSNPNFSPETAGKTMVINYSVTKPGLTNQLLQVVVGHERPDLQAQYEQLVAEMTENMNLLVKLEDALLSQLASSSGNILDNDELIATLDETKNKAVEIGNALEQAKFTSAEIQKSREQYIPAALRGSLLYFAMKGLATISLMYTTSLASFLVVFANALDLAKMDVVLDNRLLNIVNTATKMLYDYVCTGIFEKHKLMFSFQLTCILMEGVKGLSPAENAMGTLYREELDFFLKGDVSLEAVKKKKPAEWLEDRGWKDMLKLQDLKECFNGLADSVVKNTSKWKKWYDETIPEVEDIPMGFQEKLSPMQRLCVYRCFRPDRVYNAVKLFVIEKMGDTYVQPPVLDVSNIFKQSASVTPTVFILSPGADPQSDVQKLGDKLGFTGNKFKFLALGQGQGKIAEQMIETGASRGHWVLLQNCHLLTSWLKVLDKLLDGLTNPHKDFRLWLTTEPTSKFPLGILQVSIKAPEDDLAREMTHALEITQTDA